MAGNIDKTTINKKFVGYLTFSKIF